MSDNPTTKDASSSIIGADSNSPDLLKLEQAVSEAGKTEPTTETSEEAAEPQAPDMGQALGELAEKKGFKSADDFLKWNQNLEKQNTQMSQKMSELANKVEQALPKQQVEDPFANLPSEQREALDMLGRIIDQKISPLREDLEVRKAGAEIQSVKERFPGIDNTKIEEALSYVERSPGIQLEDALKIVTYESAQATSQIQKERATKTQQKKRAFVETAKTSRAGGDIDYSNLSLEELENILPQSGQYVDYKGRLKR